MHNRRHDDVSKRIPRSHRHRHRHRERERERDACARTVHINMFLYVCTLSVYMFVQYICACTSWWISRDVRTRLIYHYDDTGNTAQTIYHGNIAKFKSIMPSAFLKCWGINDTRAAQPRPLYILHENSLLHRCFVLLMPFKFKWMT